MAGCKQSRIFLEGVRDSVLLQALEGPAWGDAQLYLLFPCRENWFGDVVVNGSFGCGDHETVGFMILRGGEERAEENRSRT